MIGMQKEKRTKVNEHIKLLVISIALFVAAFQIGDILKELLKSLIKNRRV
jgi:hypothetical protein